MLKPVPPGVIRLLEEQGQVVTRHQLNGLAMPRPALEWLLGNGTWQRLDTAVYYAGQGDPPWLSLAWAASLAAGEDAVLFRESAAHLHGLVATPPDPIQLVVPTGRAARSRRFSEVTRSQTSRRTLTVTGLRCTGVADTLIDCAASMSARDLEALITGAFQRRKVSASGLRKAVNARRAIPQREILAAAAADAMLGAHSVLELDYLRNVERPHDLPVGTRQHSPRKGEYVDVYYEEYGVIVELDGYSPHALTPFRDQTRDNRNSSDGKSTLRYGSFDLAAHGCEVAVEVAELLIRRGWTGYPAACPRCDSRISLG